MFVVRFVRADGKPDEEYWYHHLEDAEYHFRLFEGDDSALYAKIQLAKVDEFFETIYNETDIIVRCS